jgi:peptidoglycan/LPS O-acetylase OafA/YrhL
MTHSDDRIPFLDHIRGVAIILVFGFHALHPAFDRFDLAWDGWLRDFDVPRSFLLLLPLTAGSIGVAIFFVVSGFCIHLSHERSKRKDLGTFFVRRFFRIYPPYFLALVLFALAFPWTRLRFDSRGDFANLGSHLLLIHNFFGRSAIAINGSFWSLAVEAQLYLLYPLLLIFTRRLGWAGALWLAGTIEVSLRSVSAATFAAQGNQGPSWLVFSPFSFWLSWSIGARLADDWLKGRPPVLGARSLWIWPVLTVIAFFIKPLFPFVFLLAALSTAGVIAFLLSHPSLSVPVPRFVRDHLRGVGVLSYSIYLLHEPLLNAVPWTLRKAFPGHHFSQILTFGSCMAAWCPILLLSWAFYRYVEQPSIRMGKAIDSRHRRPDPGRAHAPDSNAVLDRVPDPVPSS